MKGLRVETKGKSIWLLLSRPRVRNALDAGLISAIRDAVNEISSSPSRTARAVILTGDGPGEAPFCAGADLSWMTSESERGLGALFDALSAIRSCPVPVIARVTGPASGGGAGLVSACDMAFSGGATASVAFPEARLGLIPAMVSSFAMRRAGSARCSRMFLTGDRLSGAEAVSGGIIDAHFAGVPELDSHIGRVCSSIEKCSPEAIAATKRLIAVVESMMARGASIEEMKAFTCSSLARVRGTSDAKEGIKSFLEKRSPSWVSHDE